MWSFYKKGKAIMSIPLNTVGGQLICTLISTGVTYLAIVGNLSEIKKDISEMKKDIKRIDKLDEIHVRLHHNKLMESVNASEYIKLDKYWQQKLGNLSIECDVYKTAQNSHHYSLSVYESQYEKLLNYYLTHPCDDVIDLNFKGEGCSAIFSKDCYHLDHVNRLLYYTIGKLSTAIHKDKDSDEAAKLAGRIESHLYHYKTLAAHIQNNAKTKPCITDCAGTCENKIISLQLLQCLCEDSTLDKVSCKKLLQ